MFRGNRQRKYRVVCPLSKPPRTAGSLAAQWEGLSRVERDFSRIDFVGGSPQEETAFGLWFDRAGIALLVRAEITATGTVRPGASKPDPSEIPTNDSLEIQIDTSHDHENYLWFQYDSSGMRIAARRYSANFALRCDWCQRQQPIADEEWSLACEVTKDAWYSLVRVPFSLLGIKSAQELVTWGFNIVQRRYVGRELVESAWSPLVGQSQSPWDFGEILSPRAKARVTSVDFGELYYDWNTLKLSVRNISKAPRDLEVELKIRCNEGESRHARRIVLEPGETKEREIRFQLNSREYQRQEIELALRDGRRTVYQARFSAAHHPRCGGGCMVVKQGARWFDGLPPADPDPSDPDFQVKKRRYVLSRLPDFPEMGWWGGPRGDWILRDRRGSRVRLNLLSDRILEELGELIARRFPTDEERVIAATLLTHRLLIYSPIGSAVQSCLSPAGSPRQGATICSGFTCVEHGILSGTPRTDGRRGYRSWWTNVFDHTILTVELPKYRTAVDPSLGAFHYTRDHSRLATEEELFADPSLSTGTIVGREKDYGCESPRDFGWYGVLPYPPGCSDELRRTRRSGGHRTSRII